MEEGFQYLENGNFDKAEIFFNKILEEYPQNKTANICYGRAVGLNGNAVKSVEIFTQLLNNNPSDLEIQLNFAESLLWNKEYEKAKTYYTSLVIENPTNFNSLLGFANTFSNLKEFKNALIFVNKALEVSPKNPNALLSRKYIRLGFANEFNEEQKYQEAIALLNENLIDFPNDKETLLNKANIFLINKETYNAREIYYRLAINKKDSIIALNGLSLTAHIDGKNKLALKKANKALLMSKNITDTTLIKQTKERYIQALIWNKKYQKAETNINKLITSYGPQNWIISLRATLGMYRSDFKKSIEDYQQILSKDTLSFDGNLGIANAYFANAEIKKAYKSVFETLAIFKNQKDATSLLKKMNKIHTPFIEEKLSYSYDNGNNIAYASTTKISFPFCSKVSYAANYEYRKTENTISLNDAISNNFSLELNYKLHPKMIFNVKTGVSQANSVSKDYSKLLVEAFLKMQPFKLQNLELGYTREVQNFNADLVDQEIASNNLFFNYNITTNFNVGLFTQYFYTTQSDDNTRNLLFTSLYYNFLSKPVIKGGVNYQYLTFKNQVPATYFSPRKFNSIEGFIDLSNNNKNIFYSLTIANGYQFIENQTKQSTYRIQAKFGYNFSERFLGNVYATKSNIASATVSGFTFTEFGFVLKWDLTKNPIFLHQLN